MNILREGGLVSCPPLLEGSNYSYWIARMRAFIKSVNEKAWKSVVFGWQHPVIENEKKEVILKPKDLWTTLDNELASYNSKALNAIFSVVDSNQFRLIGTCETTKEAWDILQITYEGTTSVRLSKLQMLASKFEDLRIEDNETIPMILRYDDTKLVRKTLRSLLDRFAHKVIAIESAKYVTIMCLDELMTEAYEIEDVAQTDDQDMTDPVVFLTQNFQKYENASNSFSFSNDKKYKQIQCRECEGYEHIQSKCANTFKKKKEMSLNITWIGTSRISEGNTDSISKDKEKVVQTFSTNEISDYSSDEEEPSDEDIRIMYGQIVELTCQIIKLQHKLNQFKFQIVEKDMLLKSTTTELERAKTSLSSINTGKAKLDKILSTRQVGGNRQGIGYIGECLNINMDPKSKIEFVKRIVAKPSIFDSRKKKVFQKPRSRKYIPICHYCHILGPKYSKLKNDLWNEKHVRTSFSRQFEHGPKSASKHTPKIKIQLKDDFPCRIWIRKSDFRCNVANISLKVSPCESWYFDSGCYRHMTSNKSNISNFQSIEKGRVTFGDGVFGQIFGKGTLDIKGLPRLKNILLIEGLKTNLIIISQLCDQNLFVHFTKDLCHIFDNTNCCVMTGKRSANNYYLLDHQMNYLNTPQQNGVVERKNRILQEMARVMLNSKKLTQKLWAEAISIACYISNRIHLRHGFEFSLEKEIDSLTEDADSPLESSNSEKQNAHSDIPSVVPNHVIGTLTDKMRTMQKSKINYRDMVRYVCYPSSTEPKNIIEALKDELWNKTDEFGNITRNKARLVAQGYTQIEGIDFAETFAPVARAWYERLTNFLVNKGYKRDGADKILFIRCSNTSLIIAQIYVYDIVFGSTSKHNVDEFYGWRVKLFSRFTNKQLNDEIFISQSKYTQNLVKKFGLENTKHIRTPMGTNDRLSKDDVGTSVGTSLYRSMIGSLFYLTTSRSDICFSVGVYARYQSDPKESHLKADTKSNLGSYCDIDWAGDVDDRKNTSGGCFFLGNNLISWFSKKQHCISLSTVESEYIACGNYYSQLLRMKQMLADYGIVQTSVNVFCDNLSAINISNNPIQHSRIKHIDIRHHFIRELVESGITIIDHVTTENQLADIFTKAIDAQRFTALRKSLGICIL
ncbi:hypothetical protein Pfo_013660 [Paulownia fortunei]|nr:hypothetical protein Pfo_013660 [Paulownia fortunei]